MNTADTEPQVNTEGGAFVKGDVNAQKFVGRDEVHHHYADERFDVAGLPNPFPGLATYTY